MDPGLSLVSADEVFDDFVFVIRVHSDFAELVLLVLFITVVADSKDADFVGFRFILNLISYTPCICLSLSSTKESKELSSSADLDNECDKFYLTVHRLSACFLDQTSFS